MYLEHFGLREAPFRITPHTEFFFAGGNRGATLEALIYAITHDEGIVKVSGEVGSGKTMLCRMLLERLPDNVETVYLANPSMSRDEILYAIADEIGMPLPEGKIHLLLRALQERLIEIYGAGRQVVVLIDEAHAMPAESLEEIRLLSNLESNRHKLLQIVLFGQPELDARLAQTEMRQLKERVTHNFALEPLKRNDIASYLMFRMRAAGYHGPDLFTTNAIQLIARASEGLTRRVNILADKALLSAFSQGNHQVDQREAKAAIRDAQFRPMADGSARPLPWIAGALVALLGSGLVYLSLHADSSPPSALPSPPESGVSTPPGTPQPASAAAPVHPGTAASPPESPPAAPPQTVAAASEAEKPVPPPQATAESPAGAPPLELGRLTVEKLAASAAWIASSPNNRYFIQLLSVETSAAAAVETFLNKHAGSLDADQLRVYRSTLSGHDRIGIIYGDYGTRALAQQAADQLPAALRATQPYIRSTSKLR